MRGAWQTAAIEKVLSKEKASHWRYSWASSCIKAGAELQEPPEAYERKSWPENSPVIKQPEPRLEMKAIVLIVLVILELYEVRKWIKIQFFYLSLCL